MSQPDSADASPPAAVPQRQLTLFDSTCIIVGIIIGAGIYRSSPTIASLVPGVTWLLAVWLLGGLLSLIGALCYAELATAYPKEGGDYVYLTKAFGRQIGFLFAWAQLWVVRPGSIGAMAYAFADFANQIWPQADPKDASGRAVLLAYAVGSIGVLTAINILGVREGKWTQNLLTSVKVLGLGAVFLVGILCTTPSSPAKPDPHAASAAGQAGAETPPLVQAKDNSTATAGQTDEQKKNELPWDLGLAMVFVLFAYGGWNEMAYVGAEVRDPRKNILRALLVGTVAVTAIYLLVTFAFVHAVGLEGTRHTEVAANVLRLGLGDWAAVVLCGLVCVSALGAVNGQIFTGARIYYAMGTEHRVYSWLGQWSGKTGTPIPSLLMQAAITVALVVWMGPTTVKDAFGNPQGGFERMIIFTTPAFWFFLILVGLSLYVLRYREPGASRPYRVPGYPVTPLLFCLSSAYMVYCGVKYALFMKSWEALWAMGIMAVGVLVSFFDPPAKK
jgi:amino acid transporter